MHRPFGTIRHESKSELDDGASGIQIMPNVIKEHFGDGTIFDGMKVSVLFAMKTKTTKQSFK